MEYGPDVLICNRDLPLVARVGRAEGAPCHHVGLERSGEEIRDSSAKASILAVRLPTGFTCFRRLGIRAAWRSSRSRLPTIGHHLLSGIRPPRLQGSCRRRLIILGLTTACRQLMSLGHGRDYPSLQAPPVTTACRQLRSLGPPRRLTRTISSEACHHCLSAIEVVRTRNRNLR